MIEKFNTILSRCGQLTRVVSYSVTQATLSNGDTLTRNEKYKFFRRLENKKHNLWAQNIDRLLSGEITEKEIISKISSVGGTKCQAKHGDKIRKNLNTGIPHNKGTKGQNIGTMGARPQYVKDAISIANSGPLNGMFGRKMSEEDKSIKSKILKERILNGEFTPKSNNRNTHWESMFNGKFYRSSWEALYQYHNQIAEYEKLRIKYNENGNEKIYIVDFVDYENKLVIEVKPKRFINSEFKHKKKALYEWAISNGFEVILATEEWIVENVTVDDYSQFDNETVKKIKKFYETNKKNRDSKT